MIAKGKLVALLVSVVVLVAVLWGAILALGLSPRLGLDLQGGVSITLIPAPGQGRVDPGVLDQTVSVIRQRVDGLGVAEPDIARQGDTVLVQLPGVADREQAEDVIGRTAQLQFRPVLEVIPPQSPAYPQAGRPCGELQEGPPPPGEEVVLCQRTFAETDTGVQPEEPLPTEQWTKYRLGPVTVEGSQVSRAQAAVDPQSGISWLVNLELDQAGAEAFARTTGELACQPFGSPLRQFAIVLDGVVQSAPQVSEQVTCNQGITGGKAVITVGGGEAEAKELALVLRTGALPIELDFATSQNVSPTLGRDSLEAGLLAGAIGLALVTIYLVMLYRGIGLAAVAELAMFGAVVYGLIIILGQVVGFTLTLAGIAGLIVSIGIAADSSIIYRERYRDEIRAGRTVRTAADHAFRVAFRTNINGNAVSFLAAAVLYLLAVGPVRGFAFTLGLATVVDTVLFATFTRGLFGLLARSPRLATSPLMGLRAAVVTAPSASAPAPGTVRARRTKTGGGASR
jgi:protein-export membrane protein SecD